MTETTPSEIEIIRDMEAYITRIQAGAAIIHSLLQEIADLHTINDDACCNECGQAYPCSTMAIILNQMVFEEETTSSE